MTADQIRFDDGAGYEQYMGVWSQLAGASFLDWLDPRPGLAWLDVGCGNGAFTELIVNRCAPASVDGVDPSDGQLAFARTRPSSRTAVFQQGDAMALPYPADRFDVAVMPLVIFFVPDPARGVGEMARVVRPGGLCTAYAWDMEGGGFPYAALHAEVRELGIPVPSAPSPEASRLDTMATLWDGAGFEDVGTHTITVSRTFADFADYWATIRKGPSVSRPLETMTPATVAQLQERLRRRVPADASGRITYTARANAVRGRVPA